MGSTTSRPLATRASSAPKRPVARPNVAAHCHGPYSCGGVSSAAKKREVSRGEETTQARVPSLAASFGQARGAGSTPIGTQFATLPVHSPCRVGGRRGSVSSPMCLTTSGSIERRPFFDLPPPNEMGYRRGPSRAFFVILFPNRTGPFQCHPALQSLFPKRRGCCS